MGSCECAGRVRPERTTPPTACASSRCRHEYVQGWWSAVAVGRWPLHVPGGSPVTTLRVKTVPDGRAASVTMVLAGETAGPAPGAGATEGLDARPRVAFAAARWGGRGAEGREVGGAGSAAPGAGRLETSPLRSMPCTGAPIRMRLRPRAGEPPGSSGTGPRK